MDKNMMTGLLLMGAVILGFMWLNQPEPAPDSPMPDQQLTEEQTKALEADLLASPADTLSAEELTTLAKAVARYGTADSTASTYSVTAPGLELVSDGDKVSGTIAVSPSSTVSLSEITGQAASQLPKAVADSAITTVKTTMRQLLQYQGFARFLNGENRTITLANKLISVDLSTHGGYISGAELKDYDGFRGGKVRITDSSTDGYSFVLTSSNREFDTRDFYFTPVEQTDTTVLMNLDMGPGKQFGFRYTLRPDSYVVKLEVVQQGMTDIIPPSVVTMDFLWNQCMARQEQGRVFEERNSALYYKYLGGDVDNLKEVSNDAEEINERLKWIGYKNQFFSMVFIAGNAFNSADLKSEVLSAYSSEDHLKNLSTVATVDYSASSASPASFDIFIGPNRYPLLDDLETRIEPDTDLELTKLIPLGWPIFRWINTMIIIPLFGILSNVFTNYGVIILLLTIFIKIILFPFTYKSYMSQAKMRLLAPEIKEINEKYPGQENAMTRQTKTMELYSRAGANPMAGCLPMLLQMPVLIAMFTFFPSCIELRGESFLWVKDLAAPDAIISWTRNIPLVTEYFGNHISLFCLLMTVTQIIYMRITMASQPGNAAMPGMKMMNYLMPIMFMVFFNNYAAGLSYYYFLSLLISIIQTYVFRKVVSEEKMRARMAEAAKKPRKKSGFMARLEEAQRQQQAMLREQQKRQGKARK